MQRSLLHVCKLKWGKKSVFPKESCLRTRASWSQELFLALCAGVTIGSAEDTVYGIWKGVSYMQSKCLKSSPVSPETWIILKTLLCLSKAFIRKYYILHLFKNIFSVDSTPTSYYIVSWTMEKPLRFLKLHLLDGTFKQYTSWPFKGKQWRKCDNYQEGKKSQQRLEC